jgi:CRP-like cAMP-binding protein
MSSEHHEHRLETMRRSLFATLPETDLVRLVEQLAESHLPAGQFVYDPEVAIVAGGLFRAFIADSAARPVTIAYLRPGSALALARLAGRRYPTAFQAVRDSHLLLVGNDRFGELRRSHPELGWAAARELSARLDDVEEELARVAFGSLKKRLAHHTLVLAYSGGDRPEPVHLPQLMAAVGSSREAISRALAGLAREGIIAIDRGGVTVRDRGRLQENADLS